MPLRNMGKARLSSARVREYVPLPISRLILALMRFRLDRGESGSIMRLGVAASAALAWDVAHEDPHQPK